MIQLPELSIDHLLEIQSNSACWFLKNYIDPGKCLPGQMREYYQQINELINVDEQKKFVLKNFSLYARTLFNIDNEIKNFSFGLAAIRDNTSGKWGYINKKLKLVIPYRYDEVENFNVFGQAYVKLNGGWGIINKRNNFFLFNHKNSKAFEFLTYEK